MKCYSDIDDVVLQYMVSILEELGNSAASDDLFDVEQFTEMMEAYLPGFQSVDRSTEIILCCMYKVMSGMGIRETVRQHEGCTIPRDVKLHVFCT